MPRTCKLLLTATVALSLSVAMATAALAQGKGKPGGGGSTPPPPVTYALKTFEMPVASPWSIGSVRMSSSGIVVGSYSTAYGVEHPFIYDPSVDPDFAQDLNDDFDIVLANTGKRLADEGLRIVGANDINNLGFVVGPIEEIENPGVWRGYLLDLKADPPKLHLLPDAGLGHTYARRINDSMDIAGTYALASGFGRAYLFNPLDDEELVDLGLTDVYRQVELSNPAPGQLPQVVGETFDGIVFRYTREVGLDPNVAFEGAVGGVSATGGFCGRISQRQKNGKYVDYPYRYENTLEIISELQSYSPIAINSHGDLATFTGGLLYHEGTGVIKLNDVMVGSAKDLSLWSGSWYRFILDMTERGAISPAIPDFPGICGRLSDPKNGERGFVLVPVAP
jgi:hypothetical protein